MGVMENMAVKLSRLKQETVSRVHNLGLFTQVGSLNGRNAEYDDLLMCR